MKTIPTVYNFRIDLDKIDSKKLNLIQMLSTKYTTIFDMFWNGIENELFTMDSIEYVAYSSKIELLENQIKLLLMGFHSIETIMK